MNKYTNKNGTYTPVQIRKANERIVYHVIMPQGIEIKHKNSTSYVNFMAARNIKQACKLMKKYNGAYFEKCVECDLGRWVVKEFTRQEDRTKTLVEIWDKYAKLEPIKR